MSEPQIRHLPMLASKQAILELMDSRDVQSLLDAIGEVPEVVTYDDTLPADEFGVVEETDYTFQKNAIDIISSKYHLTIFLQFSEKQKIQYSILEDIDYRSSVEDVRRLLGKPDWQSQPQYCSFSYYWGEYRVTFKHSADDKIILVNIFKDDSRPKQ